MSTWHGVGHGLSLQCRDVKQSQLDPNVEENARVILATSPGSVNGGASLGYVCCVFYPYKYKTVT